MQPATQPKKGTTQTTKISDTPERTISTDNNDYTDDKSKQADKQNYQGEGDEREWQAPDVNPKYPTDVQASGKLSQSDTAQRSQETDFAMSQDEDDGLLGSEHPGFMNRH